MIQKSYAVIALSILFYGAFSISLSAQANEDDKTLRVFIFAGQSNMVGA